MQMKFNDGQYEFSQVFNVAILCYLRNSQKIDACEKLVFYSMSQQLLVTEDHRLSPYWQHHYNTINTHSRLQSRGLESLTAGSQSLRLASRHKPWLRSINGLGWLMVASHGLQVQTRKLTAAN